MSLLTQKQIDKHLKVLPGWSKKSDAIFRVFEFKDFLESIDFVSRVAKIAEQNNHHPDIDICWNKVTLTFTTHHAGGLTEKDFDVAAQCDKA